MVANVAGVQLKWVSTCMDAECSFSAVLEQTCLEPKLLFRALRAPRL